MLFDLQLLTRLFCIVPTKVLQFLQPYEFNLKNQPIFAFQNLNGYPKHYNIKITYLILLCFADMFLSVQLYSRLCFMALANVPKFHNYLKFPLKKTYICVCKVKAITKSTKKKIQICCYISFYKPIRFLL